MPSSSDAPQVAEAAAPIPHPRAPTPLTPAPQTPTAQTPTPQTPIPPAPDLQARDPDAPTDSLRLHLEGFEGPLDLLLDLARTQKVDLARISILALVEQYLAVIEGARRVRLELAADWLVMAAWLAWLKSKLLLPAGADEAEEAGTAAEVLAARLRDLQAMRAAALWLAARPRLGVDTFARGAPEDHTAIDRTRLLLDLTSLVRAYVQLARRQAATHRTYRPRPVSLWSVQDALTRLARLLGSLPDWTSLDAFLPDELGSPLQRRAALASTLLAGLELARGGTLRLRQQDPFGPILLRRADATTDAAPLPDAPLAQKTPNMEGGT